MHGLAHLAAAALAFPRPDDLGDDTYVGRVSVDQVDGAVREACRVLDERVAGTAEADPLSRRAAAGGGVAGVAAPPGGDRDQGRPRGRGHHARHRREGAAVPGRPGLPGRRSGRTASTARRPATRCRSASWPPSGRSTSCSTLGCAVPVAGRRQPMRGVAGCLSSAGSGCSRSARPAPATRTSCLDLRGVGAPVPAAARQATCSPPTTSSGVPRRPVARVGAVPGERRRQVRAAQAGVLGAAAGPPPGRRARPAPTCWRSSCSARTSRTSRCEWMHTRHRGAAGHRQGVRVARPRRLGRPGPARRRLVLVPARDRASASTTCRSPPTARRVTMAGVQGPAAPSGTGADPARELVLGDRRTATGRATSSTSGWTRSCSATSGR